MIVNQIVQKNLSRKHTSPANQSPVSIQGHPFSSFLVLILVVICVTSDNIFTLLYRDLITFSYYLLIFYHKRGGFSSFELTYCLKLGSLGHRL